VPTIPLRRAVLVAAALVALAASLPAPAGANPGLRSFMCSGSLGEPFTAHTVTGKLTAQNIPTDVRVVRTGTGAVESTLTGAAAPLGASWLHSGYVAHDVTGPDADGDTFALHTAPVLPGNGGFFDADLEIAFAGGAEGEFQIPMLDCTVTGGPQWLSAPGLRSFSCTGDLGEAFTARTVAGELKGINMPRAVTVTQTRGGLVESTRPYHAGSLGASWLHGGYTAWDVTGPNPNGDVFTLHVPPVLPPAGGFFDAELEIAFAGGAAGEWQIPMFDCAVR